jgi:hypothetical protein
VRQSSTTIAALGRDAHTIDGRRLEPQPRRQGKPIAWSPALQHLDDVLDT